MNYTYEEQVLSSHGNCTSHSKVFPKKEEAFDLIQERVSELYNRLFFLVDGSLDYGRVQMESESGIRILLTITKGEV